MEKSLTTSTSFIKYIVVPSKSPYHGVVLFQYEFTTYVVPFAVMQSDIKMF